MADARDIAAAVSDVAQGKEGSWAGLGAVAVGDITQGGRMGRVGSKQVLQSFASQKL